MLKDIQSTTFLSIIGRSGGVMLPFLIANIFGVSAVTDSLFFSLGLAMYFVNIFAPALEKSIVSYIAGDNISKQDRSLLVGGIISRIGVGITIVVLIAILILDPAILRSLSGFDNNGAILSRNIFIIFVPLIVLMIFSALIAGSLNAFKEFHIPAISPLIRFVCVVLMILALREQMGIYSVIVGLVIGEGFRFLFMLAILHRKKLIHLRLSFERKSVAIQSFFRTVKPQIYASILYGAIPIIDRTMASWMGTGSISIYYYAERIYFIPFTLLTIGVTPVILSHWGKSFNETNNENRSQLKSKILKSQFILFLISTIIVIVMILMIDYILTILFMGENLMAHQLALLRLTSIFFLLGLVPAVLTVLQTAGIVVTKDTRILYWIAILVVIIKPILNLILLGGFDLAGLALSTAIIHVLILCCQMYWFRKFTIHNNIKAG